MRVSALFKGILDHLGLSPADAKPPPDTRDILRVPVDDEGRELEVT